MDAVDSKDARYGGVGEFDINFGKNGQGSELASQVKSACRPVPAQPAVNLVMRRPQVSRQRW